MPFDSVTSTVLPRPLYRRPLELDPWDPLFRSLILAGLAALIYLSFRWQIFQPVLHAVSEHPWAGYVLRPSMLWMAMGTLMLLFRTLLWFRYRTPPMANYADAPTLTVIIPAYNEGAMVAQSIDSVAKAHYPGERLRILVVDDGSRDDTWEHIQAAAARHPGLVRTIKFTCNQGKRAALETGFRLARSEVVVTIDSDSVIENDALLAMVGPFRDPKVGAVAGKVAVYNLHQGLIRACSRCVTRYPSIFYERCSPPTAPCTVVQARSPHTAARSSTRYWPPGAGRPSWE